MNTTPKSAGSSLLDANQLLTDFAESEILKNASKLSCECPKHLLFILEKVRSFQEYEKGCINSSEKDRATHEWLLEQSLKIDRLVSSVIIDLARREGMITEQNDVVPYPKR